MLSIFKTNFKIICFLILFVFLFPCAGFSKGHVLYKGTVNSYKLNIRSKPSRSADVVTVLDRGQLVDVIHKKGGIGGWLTIEYNGLKGYIRNRPKYITLRPVKLKVKAPKVARSKPTQKKQPEIQKKKITVPAKQLASKKEQEKIKEKILTQEKLAKTFTEKEKEIIEGLNEIDYALNKARLTVTSLSQEIIQLEEKIKDLNKKRDRLSMKIATNRAYAGKRLKALYKMNMIGRLDMSGMPTSVFDFVLQQNSMKKIISSDYSLLEKQKTDFEAFELIREKLAQEKEAKTALEVEYKDQIRIKKKETLKKELILRDIRHKKKLSLAAVESLKDAAIRLDQQISNLQSSQTGEQTLLSFSSYKGRLKIPAKGKIISKFGPTQSKDHKSFTFQKGIDIKVERGEPVKSVFKGEIKFAQWLKGYGNLLIIDHGDSYYTLYAHVEEMFKKPGEKVETGEVIATAGDSGSMKGLCLHFEVRHHGKPINPMKWLRKGASG